MKFFILFSGKNSFWINIFKHFNPFLVFSIASGWLFANPFNYFRPAINITNSTDAWTLNSTNFTDIEDTEKYFNISNFSDIDLEALCTLNDPNSTSFTSSNTIDPSLAISKYTDHSSDKSSKFNHINSSFSHNYTTSNSTDFAFNITEVCTFFNAINVNITDTATTTDELTTNPPECNSNNCDQLLPLMNWNNLTMIVWPSTEQEAIEYCDHWAKYGLCLEKYSTAKKSDCIRRDVVIEDDQLTMSLVEKYHSLVCQNSSTMVSFIDRAACYLHPSVLEDIFTARYQWKAMTSWDQVCATLWFIESIRSSMDRNCEASVAESYQAMVDVVSAACCKLKHDLITNFTL